MTSAASSSSWMAKSPSPSRARVIAYAIATVPIASTSAIM